jgi:hypothetical protein
MLDYSRRTRTQNVSARSGERDGHPVSRGEIEEPSSGAVAPETTTILNLDAGLLLRRLLVFLIVSELLIVYLDIVVTYFEAIDHPAVADLCNMVIEEGINNWFSSMQTLVVGLVVLLITARVALDPAATRGRVLAWALISLFFFYMAFDDGVGFHEAMGTWFDDDRKAAAGGTGLSAWLLAVFPSYAWQILFLPALGALGLFTVAWSFKEMSRRGRILVFAGIACFVFAVGLDFVEGMEWPYESLTAQLQLHEDTVPHLSGVLEEFTEMFGTTLLLYAFLEHLLGICRNLRLRVTSGHRA